MVTLRLCISSAIVEVNIILCKSRNCSQFIIWQIALNSNYDTHEASVYIKIYILA